MDLDKDSIFDIIHPDANGDVFRSTLNVLMRVLAMAGSAIFSACVL